MAVHDDQATAADTDSQPSLSLAHLDDLPATILRPAYDPARTRIGVVHLGPGAFHRAHQAWFFDDLLARDPHWAISAVALRTSGVRDALQAQDGLYTVAVLDETSQLRVIGSLRELLVANEQPQAVMRRLVDENTRVVTLTVTEKGYCLGRDGQLDFDHPDIRHDLAQPGHPISAVGWLVAALAARRRAGHRPFTTICCDNLTSNGRRLAAAVSAYARAHDGDLASWIDDEARFPSTMVDSIVPATDDDLRRRVDHGLGLHDRWPVQREAFSQWVISREFCNAVPDLASVGATLVDDVAGFENAKLRLLNGAHSTLAYVGLLRGHDIVANAMRDADLAAFVRELMHEAIKPTLRAGPELDLDHYIDAVLQRFRNPTIRHELAQIAWDGSQKLPFRILGTVRDAIGTNRPLERLCVPLAAWCHFLHRAARDQRKLVDPLAGQLLDLAAASTGAASDDIAQFLTLTAVFGTDLPAHNGFVAAMTAAYARLAQPQLALSEQFDNR